jgi:hypothetical protein
MKKRGFTLVEVLLTCVVSVILIGATATVYTFTATRTAHALATVSTSSQMQELCQRIDETVAKAISVQVVTVGSIKGLKCTMPATGIDSDSDSYLDVYKPTSATGGSLRWGKGKRVWFYMSNSTGNFGTAGAVLWRAERTDDAFPTTADADTSFAYKPGNTVVRYPLLESITWAADGTDKTVSYTLVATSLIRADRKASAAFTTEKETSRTVTLKRTTNWTNNQ